MNEDNSKPNLCDNCTNEIEKKEKIVYTMEVRRQNGKYNCDYNNYLESASDNLAVIKMLKAEIDKILEEDVTEYNIGTKGDFNEEEQK